MSQTRNEMYAELIDYFETTAWVLESAQIQPQEIEKFLYPRSSYTFQQLQERYKYVFTELMKATNRYEEAIKLKIGGTDVATAEINRVWQRRLLCK